MCNPIFRFFCGGRQLEIKYGYSYTVQFFRNIDGKISGCFNFYDDSKFTNCRYFNTNCVFDCNLTKLAYTTTTTTSTASPKSTTPTSTISNGSLDLHKLPKSYADVLIVGGGFTGLTTAFYLSKYAGMASNLSKNEYVHANSDTHLHKHNSSGTSASKIPQSAESDVQSLMNENKSDKERNNGKNLNSLKIMILESKPYVGGCVETRTSRDCTYTWDMGPNSFRLNEPSYLLIKDLNLECELDFVENDIGRHLALNKNIQPLPRTLSGVLTTPLLSIMGKLNLFKGLLFGDAKCVSYRKTDIIDDNAEINERTQKMMQCTTENINNDHKLDSQYKIGEMKEAKNKITLPLNMKNNGNSGKSTASLKYLDKNDESVYQFASRVLGVETVDRLLDGMITGIYAGDINKLSMKSSLPKIYVMLNEGFIKIFSKKVKIFIRNILGGLTSFVEDKHINTYINSVGKQKLNHREFSNLFLGKEKCFSRKYKGKDQLHGVDMYSHTVERSAGTPEEYTKTSSSFKFDKSASERVVNFKNGMATIINRLHSYLPQGSIHTNTHVIRISHINTKDVNKFMDTFGFSSCLFKSFRPIFEVVVRTPHNLHKIYTQNLLLTIHPKNLADITEVNMYEENVFESNYNGYIAKNSLLKNTSDEVGVNCKDYFYSSGVLGVTGVRALRAVQSESMVLLSLVLRTEEKKCKNDNLKGLPEGRNVSVCRKMGESEFENANKIYKYNKECKEKRKGGNIYLNKDVNNFCAFDLLPKSFGFLVPENEGRLHKWNSLGGLFVSHIFNGRAPVGEVIYTAFIGGSRNKNAHKMRDDILYNLALCDVKRVIQQHTRHRGFEFAPRSYDSEGFDDICKYQDNYEDDSLYCKNGDIDACSIGEWINIGNVYGAKNKNFTVMCRLLGVRRWHKSIPQPHVGHEYILKNIIYDMQASDNLCLPNRHTTNSSSSKSNNSSSNNRGSKNSDSGLLNGYDGGVVFEGSWVSGVAVGDRIYAGQNCAKHFWNRITVDS